MILYCQMLRANDGVFMVNGNQLTPMTETDVAITKEVLTITLCDDDTARIDVLYEMDNRGEAKTVNVGFVAEAPYNSSEKAFDAGHHPYINAFTVNMNGQSQSVNCYVMAYNYGKPLDFTPVDMRQWMGYTEAEKAGREYVGSEVLCSVVGDSVLSYAYAYCFKADFKSGHNVIHHTYKYVMSNSVYSLYEIPYTLTPAMRWANHQIDDFTLRIRVENTAKHFAIDRRAFADGEFVVTEGVGKHRTSPMPFDSIKCEEVALRDGVIEWHCKNYTTENDMMIYSADYLLRDRTDDVHSVGAFYDRRVGDRLVWLSDNDTTAFDGNAIKRIRRNLPYAHRGYVFRDKRLNDYFNKLFWYMPNPEWKASTDGFTEAEWELIRGE